LYSSEERRLASFEMNVVMSSVTVLALAR